MVSYVKTGFSIKTVSLRTLVHSHMDLTNWGTNLTIDWKSTKQNHANLLMWIFIVIMDIDVSTAIQLGKFHNLYL